MERRLDQRWPANLEATLTDIALNLSARGLIVDVSQSGVRVRVPFELAPGSIVKLQIVDSVLFGEVIHSHAEGSGSEVGIEVVRVLIGESDLARLVNAILAESMPRTPGLRMAVQNPQDLS